MHDKILILDFGSQVTQLIARRVREAHVFCEIHPNDVGDAFMREFAPKGIILSGSPRSTYEERRRRARRRRCSSSACRCSASATACSDDGRAARRQGRGERRSASSAMPRCARAATRALLEGIEDFTTAEGHGMLKVWMSHGDKVTALPPGFTLMASTPSCPIAGMADEARRFYGVQFHPEVTHTVQGPRRCSNRFVLEICGAQARLGDGQLHRRSGRADPRAGRRRRGDPRAVGRRRFERRGGADPPRDRRPADLRVRRPRPAAPDEGRAGDGHVRRAPAA